MNNFPTIITKLKILLSQRQSGKVHDRDVAAALGLSPSTFASMKRRGNIPYRALLDFCAEHHINANALLFQRPANNFIKAPVTIRYHDRSGDGNGLNGEFKELTMRELLILFLDRLDRTASC